MIVQGQVEKGHLKSLREKSLFYFLYFNNFPLNFLRWPFSTLPLNNDKSFEDSLIKIESQIASFPPYETPCGNRNNSL